MNTRLILFLALAASAAAEIRFNRDVRPVLSENCFHCHGPAKEGRKARLRLDTPDGAAEAINSGEFLARIRSESPEELMPPPDSQHALTDAQKDLLERWIKDGAAYQGHWSFEAPVSEAKGELPAIIDAEIAKGLADVGLSRSPVADSATLIRRLSLDLRGIPPSLAEIDDFDGNWEALIDRFLASPECAERLALDWLDVARYADTNGYSIDDHRDMWVWRDWAIHAFRHNKPYDDFIIEQLAGDLMPAATPEQKMATGFLRNSMNTHEGGTIAEEYRVAYLADKVDTVSSTFMGLTMACAQCHDHKYDPISQKDYYRFYAFFDAATERGKGATNGNTQPVIRVSSPLKVDIEAAISARLERIKALRKDPGELTGDSPAKSATFTFRMPQEKPHWIWADKTGDISHIHIRKPISIDKPLKRAQVYFTCDNNADLLINGAKLAHVDPWMEPKLVDITAKLKDGDNELLADARNAGGVAAFIAWVQLDFKDGETRYLLSDTSWLWRTPQSQEWKAPLSLGKHGVGPWGSLSPPGVRTPQSFLTKRYVKNLGIEAGNLEKQLKSAATTTVMIMDNPGKRKTRILMRGAYDQPGEEVSAGVPEILPPLPEDAPANRLGLAQWLVGDDHPLTARVIVNRYWQLLFGAGLVRTSEDFGAQGEWPSHPELLDALAVRFRDSGWDLRYLLKSIAMSDTYRQQSAIRPSQQKADPYNRLLGSAPRFRLQAELVRDNALSIGGILDQQLGGPSVYPSQPAGLWRQVSHFGHGTFTAQAYYPDHSNRRSMYTAWKRTAPPPAMAIFDAPNRETCTIRRQNTNTPLQALVLLNDPQYLAAARGLAQRMLTEGGDQPLVYAFRLATSRQPSAEETAVLRAALQREQARFAADSAAAADLLRTPQTRPKLAAYTMLASTILNLNETITRQ